MADVVAFGELLSDRRYDVNAFTHHLVVNCEVSAKSVNVRRDCPDVKIMYFIHARDTLDGIHYLRRLEVFGYCLQ